MMKKTLFYNFLGSKEEELASEKNLGQKKVSKVVVEIRDDNPPPVFDHRNPWQIKKKLTTFEVTNGKLVISSKDTFNHIFRYFDLDMANNVVSGNKAPVQIRDISGHHKYPGTYYGAEFYLEMLADGDHYALACKNIIQDRQLGVGDEIGLFVEPWHLYFVFEVLSRGNVMMMT